MTFLTDKKIKKQLVSLILGVLTLGTTVLSASKNLYAASTTPATINYQGRLLNAANVPLSGNYTFRFSIWNTSDWTVGDTDGLGAINVGSAGYAGWQETHAVTLAAGDYGLFNMSLGDTVAFPSFNAGTHKNLQVEVKATGALDTTYEILDPQGTLADAVDRKPLQNQAFAQNADTIDNADIGTAAGNLAVLGAGGVWDIARIPGGTNANSFVIDNDNTGGISILQFGNDGTDGSIAFDNATGDITFATPGADNFTFDNGTLVATADAGLDFSNSDQFRIRESANPNLSAACAALGELIFNTGSNKLMVCTAIGTPGTWANVDSAGAVDDFETVYAADADKTLTSGNANFTVNTGTGDFIVTSNDWGVDASGNITTNGTVDGVDISNLQFSNIATRAKKQSFKVEYEGATLYQDGTANKGLMVVENEVATLRNYYKWTTQQIAMQDMDVVLSFKLPMDFVSFTASPIAVDYKTNDAVVANNRVDIALYDNAGAAVGLTGGSALANMAWTTANITFSGAPVFVAGDTVTIKLKLSSIGTGFAQISDIVLNYNGR